MDKLFKLTFLGDIMCKSQMLPAYMKGEGVYCFDSLFNDVAYYLKKSDFVMANLETPISEYNSDLTAERWCFNSPFELAEAVYKAGISVVAIANNHCLDRGIVGITSTINSLKLDFFIQEYLTKKKNNR